MLCCILCSDLKSRWSLEEMEPVLRLHDLVLSQRQRRTFDVLETSAVNGKGMSGFADWLLPGAGRSMPVL